MAKHKMKRVGIAIDMTPLVDVAFLLLTFFMMTTQFKPPEAVEIKLPTSHATVKLPSKNLIMVSIGKDGRVFLGADNTNGRDVPGANGDVQVAPADLTSAFMQLRSANPMLRTVIKADETVKYSVIEDVMQSLQEAKITRFALVTDLERS